MASLVLSAVINLLFLTTPLYMMQIFDRVLSGRREETLVLLTVIAVFAYIAYGFLDWARNQLMAGAGTWVERQLAGPTLMAALNSTVQGSAISGQGLRDLTQVRNLISGRSLFPLLDFPWSLIFFAILWMLDYRLGIYALACTFILVALAVAGEMIARRAHRRGTDKQALVNRWADQAIAQADAIKAMGMQDNLLKRHKNLMDQTHQENRWASGLMEAFAATARAARQISQLGIMALAAWLLLQGDLSPGVVIGASIILSRALAPVDILISSWQQFITGINAYGRLCSLLEAYENRQGTTEPPEPMARLAVINLHKRNPLLANSFLLQGINLNLSQSEVVGIIGPSGSGKTTLCRLLAGITRPDIGEIRLDAAKLEHWPGSRLGRYIGYLPQDVGLPPATVAETIARLSPEPDLEQVYTAARNADAHDLIMSLPNGYDTLVGAGGVALSGGQRQRVGLARALFGDPVLLVLDEPDAHLDNNGIQALANAITKVKARGAITVVVSHRPQFMQLMDTILLLSEGKMADCGARDTVLPKLLRNAPPKESQNAPQTVVAGGVG
ncbi:type I secretion system permease/ATPase [Aestuariispira insulae]|nr:type I secretion system permease/ATPase [Aestuariispira insulae]